MLRKSKFFVLLNILLIVMLMLTGCDQGGGDATPADGGDSGDTGGETTGVELTESVEAELPFAKLTVKYPSGWAAEASEEGVTLANRSEIMDMMSDPEATLEETDVVLIIGPMPASMEGQEFTAESVIEVMAEEGNEPEEVTIGDMSGFKVLGGDEKTGGAIYALNYNEDLLLTVFVVTAPDKYEDAMADAEAIIGAVSAEVVEAEGG